MRISHCLHLAVLVPSNRRCESARRRAAFVLDLQASTDAFSWLVGVAPVLITALGDVFLLLHPSGEGFGTLFL